MEEEVYAQQQFSTNESPRVRDLEEKQRILKDRVLLIGQSLVEEKEKRSSELREIKKTLAEMKEENTRIKELLQRITEQLGKGARKEELMTLQRQFDLFRNEK